MAIKLTNSGAEVHELQVLRIKSSKDKLKAIVNLPEKKARKKVESVGSGFAVPGETGYTFLNLTKSGNYGAVCFVPVGSTPDQEEGGDGPPHAARGHDQGVQGHEGRVLTHSRSVRRRGRHSRVAALSRPVLTTRQNGGA